MSDISHSDHAGLPDARVGPGARMVLDMLSARWEIGTLLIRLPNGSTRVLKGSTPGPSGELHIRDFRFARRVLAGGDIGFAEGYMAGEWDTPDLSNLLEVLADNHAGIQRLFSGGGVVRFANRLLHGLRRNSRSGSRKNIHAHYDLGNSFYSQWLDETMTYSSAIFEKRSEPLPAAQTRKYAELARAMDLSSGQSVLEIGCGWGGFAEFAAREVGARVTGITISREQYESASARLQREGLNERAEVRLIDYRDVEGRFDRVASIEMFEAVGESYWPTYFGKIREVLGEGGRAALQIITIRDDLFESYRQRVDFIQRYIFPGGMLPSEKALAPVVAAAGLDWTHTRRFGESYARTLSLWDQSFERAWDRIRPLGFDERFRKLWRFYLSYCEAGFRTGRTNVIQMGLSAN
jgi:cyclopropane-fatty-acyl-phospholipid synthase